jgi:enolase
MASIKSIRAREVFDSRGNPTVEVDLISDSGLSRAMVPSGASTGVHEALELRDGGKRLMGKGVLRAVKNVNEIAKKVVGMDPTGQRDIDDAMIELDGTENKDKLGANAILAVSMAVCRAGALERRMPLYKYVAGLMGRGLILPVPSMNVINGGAHAGNKLDIQEYMIQPIGAKTFKEAMVMGAEVYQTLKKIIKDKYGKTAINVGDEGGFAPPLDSFEEPLNLILEAVKAAGYEKEIKLALDSAASNFYKDGVYILEGGKLTGEELAGRYEETADSYPIILYEDPFGEEDFESFALLTSGIGDKIQIVGDDLLVTNVERIKKAIKLKACNALLLKVNQIGTVSEAIDAAKLAVGSGWNVMVSHRSGETEDSFIADLVVGLGTGQIKSGAPCRSERLAKYNQLIRIEEELGKNAKYAGDYRKH